MLTNSPFGDSDSGVDLSLSPAADGSFTLPSVISPFTSEFARDGSDLLLEGADGLVARLPGYFDTEVPLDLTAHDGATLRGSTVERLAGPLFPGQYAQAGGASIAEAIGQVETLEGIAFAQRTDGTLVQLALGEKVFQGDIVRTDGGSTLGLTFADGTIFTLASGSRMVLDELIYDPDATDNSGVFDLIEGSFVFIAGQTAKTGGIEITTPAATMGIRGTTGKIDIQTVNGVSTVTVSLNADPDGGLGAIELFDLSGNLISTITGTATKWIISPPFADQPPIEVDRDIVDLNNDSALLSQAIAAFQAATTRVEQGETFVELPNAETEGTEEDQAPEPAPQETAPDDEAPLGAPTVPPPLDETGDDGAQEGDAGTGNPELDGRDEPIIDEEAGPSDDDDASLDVPTPTEPAEFDDAGGQTQFADISVQSVEDTALTAQLPVSNRTGESVAVSLERGAENGLVVLASDGTFTYTPNADFDGTDSFVISGVDDQGEAQQATVTVVVDPVNDAPVVTARTTTVDSIETGAGTAPDSGTISGTLSYVDVDEQTTTGTWQIAASEANDTAFGTITIDPESGLWRYNLNQEETDALQEGETFEETFVATVTDAEGASDSSTLVVTVTGSNDAPVIAAEVTATAASMVTGPGAQSFGNPDFVTTGLVSGALTYSDVDEGEQAATWSIAAQDGNDTALGEIAIDATTGTWTYTLDPSAPVPLANGETTVETYIATVTDEEGATSDQAVVITIAGTNEVPTIVFSIEDVSATVQEDGFSSDAAVSASTVTADAAGLRSLRSDSSGVETFQRTSANTTDAPNATGTLRYTDEDGQPGAATWSVAPQDATLGEMTIDPVTGEWHYFLDQEAADGLRSGDEVVETFLATVTDPFGGVATQVITITVQGANDAATIETEPQDLVGAVAEGGVATASGRLSFVDPDAQAGETASWSVTPDGTSRGVMTIDADTGQWLYVVNAEAAEGLAAGAPVTETFTATVTDSLGATADQTITITLTGQNDAPTMAAGSASVAKQQPTLDIDLTALGADIDAGETGATLTYEIAQGPLEGSATIVDGTLVFNTQSDFDDLSEGDSRDVFVDITATDAFGAQAAATVTITVTGSNTAPVITSDASRAAAAVTEPTASSSAGTTATNTLTYTDVDASTPTSGVWSAAPAGARYGSLTIDPASGDWVYTVDPAAADQLNAGQTAQDRFVATITDEDGQTDAQEITITVTGTNDAPLLSAGSGTVTKSDPSLSINLSLLGSDPDSEDSGASLSYSLVSTPTSGSASINGTTLIFQTDNAFDDLGAGDTRDVVVAVQATDARGATVTSNVTITVTGSDTGPVITSTASDGEGTVTEAGHLTPGIAGTRGTLTYTDADAATPTSGTWTVTPDITTYGAISINADTGAWSYALNNTAANSLDAGDQLFETFTATITDASGLSASQQINITINGTNDAPVFDADTRTIDKNTASTVFDLTTQASDVDADDATAGLTFAVVSGPYDGRVTLSGGQLTFFTDGDFDGLAAGATQQVNIDVSATDTQGVATQTTLTVTVTGTNTAPVITSTAAAASASVREPGVGSPVASPAATGVLTYSDPDEGRSSGTWAIDGNTPGNYGEMSIDPISGAWSFTLFQATADSLTEGQVVQETYTATVTDFVGASDTQTMVMTITGTNDAPTVLPTVSDTTGSAQNGGTSTLSGTLAFADVDSAQTDGTWTIAPDAGTTPTYGSMSVTSGGTWTYTVDQTAVAGLPENASLTESYVATITDDFGATDQITVVISIAGSNDAPVITSGAVDALGAVTENSGLTTVPQTASGTLSYTDADEGMTLGSWSVTPVASALGTMSIDAATGAWTYTLDDAASDALDAGDSVTETFTATITDAGGLTADQVISVTITGTNDAPTLTQSGSFSTSEDGPLLNIDLSTIWSDPDGDDDGSSLTYELLPVGTLSTPLAGSSLSGSILSFDPANRFHGLSTGEQLAIGMNIRATDPDGASTTGFVTAQITGVNDAPTFTNSTASVNENSGLTTISLAGLGSDVDGDDNGSSLTYTLVAGSLTRGTAVISGTDLQFNTNGDFDDLAVGQTEVVSLSIIARDQHGAESLAGTVDITVTGQNDAPFIGAGTLAAGEDGPAVTLDLASLANDIDDGEDGSTLIYTLQSPVAGASISGTTLRYDASGIAEGLAEDETQDVVLTVVAEDAGGIQATSTVTVTVTGANDAPTLDSGTVVEVETGSTGTLDLRTLADDVDSDDTADTLTYRLPTPVIGASISGNTLSFDPGTRFAALADGETAQVDITVQAEDSNGAQTNTTVTVSIDGQNDAPTISDATLAATEDGAVATLDLVPLGGDVDMGEDGSTLTYSLASPVAGVSITDRTLSFDPTGNFQTLAEGDTTDVAVTLVATDGFGATAQSTLTITVTGANDAPTLSAGMINVTEDGTAMSLDLSVLGADVDSGQDGSTLSYFLEGAPANVSITDRTLTFDPGADFQDLAEGETRDVVFTIRAEDGVGGIVREDVTVTVTGANDAPTLVNGTGTAPENDAATLISLIPFGSDADGTETGATLTYEIVSGPAEGSATIVGTDLRFVPGTDFDDLQVGETEDVTVQVRALDAAGAVSNTATISVTVQGANDAPVIGDFNLTYDGTPSTVLAVDVLASATDPDDTIVGLVAVGTTPNGTVTIDNRGTPGTQDDLVNYTPNSGFSGIDSFTYNVADARGATSQATINVNVTNTAPIAEDFTAVATLISRAGASFFADSSTYYQFVRGNYTFDEANTLAQAQGGFLATLRSEGEGVFAASVVAGLPSDVDAWLGGSDATTEGDWRWITDGSDGAFWSGDSTGSPIGSNYFNWAAGQPDSGGTDANDHLAISRFDGSWDDVQSTDPRGYLVEFGNTLLGGFNPATDGDVGDTLTYALVNPVDGLAMAANGFWTFDPQTPAYEALSAGETTDLVAEYRVTDSAGASSISTLTITLTGANDAPTVVDESAVVTAAIDTGVPAGSWTFWDPDEGGNGHYYQYVTARQTWANAKADAEARGGHLATITSGAENGFVNSLATVQVGWIGATDAAEEGTWSYVGGPENGRDFFIEDGSGDGSALGGAYTNWDTVAFGASGSGGSDVVLMMGDGRWRDFDDNGFSTFEYYVEYSGPPVATGNVGDNDSDPEGDSITYTLSGSYDGLTLNSDGSWVFDLTDPAYAYLDQGESEFIYAYYTATDAGGASTNGRLVIEVQGVNDAPVLGADNETVTIVADSPPPGVDWTQWTQATGGNDHYYQFVTSSTLTWSAARADAAANNGYLATVTSADEQTFVAGIAAGRVAFLGGSDAAEEGTWIWVDGPEAGQQFWQSAVGGATAGPVGGSYVNWDAGQPSTLASGEDVLHLFGDGSWNDLVDADTPSTTFGYVMEYSGPLNVTGSIATNDTDPEGGNLTYAATNSVQGLTLAADGTWSLDQTDPNFVTLAQGETSSLALTYTATDAGGATANGTLNITLEGANDAPSIEDDAETVNEGSGVTAFDLSLISSDPDNGDTLTYQIISAPVAGLASIVGNELRFDTNGDFAALNDGETEDVTVELRATDGSGATDTATVTVTITGDSPAITTVDDTVAPRTEDAGFTTSTASFTSNDVEPNGEALVITSVSAVSAFGAPVTLSGTNVSYSAFRSTQLNDLNAGQTVTDSFTYTVENMSGTLSATGTVRVDITGVDQIDNDPVPFGTTTVGFQSGGSGEYKINDNWLRDDDEGTGITYKFGLITADAPLPDFLTYDTSARVLLIDQAEYSELTDEGFTNLVVTGFEGDSDYTSIPFGVYITTSEGKGIMDFVLFGGGTSGFTQTLEVGLNPEFGLGPAAVGASVDLSGIESLLDPSSTSAIADVGVIDLSNGQANDLALNAGALLGIIDGNAANANEQVDILVDSFDSVSIDSSSEWTVNLTDPRTAELTGTVGGAFEGLGLFATIQVDAVDFTSV